MRPRAARASASVPPPSPPSPKKPPYPNTANQTSSNPPDQSRRLARPASAQRTKSPTVVQRGRGRVALGRKAAAFRLPKLLLSSAAGEGLEGVHNQTL